MTNGSTGVWKIILIPSLITLAVTVIRLVGELNQWNETFFRRGAGGAGAIVGIVWLAFIFAVYFALKVRRSGNALPSAGKAFLWTFLAIAVFVGGEYLIFAGYQSHSTPRTAAGILAVVVAIMIMRLGWPSYWNVLISYALAARIPVAILMYFALRGAWGTHYDAIPPEMKTASFAAQFFNLAVVPQLTFWVAFTVIICGLFGIIAGAVGKRRDSSADERVRA
jgi:hypothetical protein